MNSYVQLLKRQEENNPIRVGIIGMGRVSSMYCAHVHHIPGVHLVGVCDINMSRALSMFKILDWKEEDYSARSMEDAYKKGNTFLTDNAEAIISSPYVDIIMDCTGVPAIGIQTFRMCCKYKKHIVMLNVEADVLAGPLMKRMADEAGIIYSLAYGDQPAIACDLVDWARTSGFNVISAGEWRKSLPNFHDFTPDDVWNGKVPGLTHEYAVKNNLNPVMFNSFLDGTKGAVEICAISNATGLKSNPAGASYTPTGYEELPQVFRPVEDGGVLIERGMVDIAGYTHPDGTYVDKVFDLGIFITCEMDRNEYERNCFTSQFASKGRCLKMDDTGKYVGFFRHVHCVGLEMNVTVAAMGIYGDTTGAPIDFVSDVVTIAKKDLTPGELMDGEGGYAAYGECIPADMSLAKNALPFGVTHKAKVIRPVKKGQIVTWDDVEVDETSDLVKIRREMEATFKNTKNA